MDIHNCRPRPIPDLPVTVNSFRTRGGLSNALPFSGEGRPGWSIVALPGPRGGHASFDDPRGPGSLTRDRELTGPRPLQRLVRQLVDLFADCHPQISGRSRLLEAESSTSTSLPTTAPSTLAAIEPSW